MIAFIVLIGAILWILGLTKWAEHAFRSCIAVLLLITFMPAFCARAGLTSLVRVPIECIVLVILVVVGVGFLRYVGRKRQVEKWFAEREAPVSLKRRVENDAP